MFRSRVIGSILKRNEAHLTNVSSNLKEIASRRVISSSSSSTAARSSFYGFRSLFKGNYVPSARNMSVAASVGMKNKEGLKLLVTGGPHAQKMVSIWLYGSAALLFSALGIGAFIRLFRSGLSMTWKFSDGLHPLSDEELLQEFEKYKQSPEYKLVNKEVSIEDFKLIYGTEYALRMFRRGLGIVFALPFSYFLCEGYITLQLGLRLSALFALSAGQGFIGLWPVESGVEEPPSEYSQPRASPYLLAAHLTSSFVIYSGLFWTALSVDMPEPTWVRGAAKVRKLALPVSLIVGITAISGAFVAGNDVGRADNTSPKMGDTWFPDDIFDMKPLLRNFFENASTAQIVHRILATTTLLSIGYLWLATRKLHILPADRELIRVIVGMAAFQVTLGISTLLSYVQVSRGSADYIELHTFLGFMHQTIALLLLTLMMILNHIVRKPSTCLLKSLPQIAKTI